VPTADPLTTKEWRLCGKHFDYLNVDWDAWSLSSPIPAHRTRVDPFLPIVNGSFEATQITTYGLLTLDQKALSREINAHDVIDEKTVPDKHVRACWLRVIGYDEFQRTKIRAAQHQALGGRCFVDHVVA
jgi:hypothetical protein